MKNRIRSGKKSERLRGSAQKRGWIAVAVAIACNGSFASADETELRKEGSGVADLDNYGTSVAVNEKYTLVGIPGAAAGGTNRGEAKVYNRTTGALINTLTPIVADKEDNSQFGSSVALNGECAIVGAYLNNEGGGFFDRGAVFIFDVITGTQLLKLVPTDPLNDSYFGFDVASHGNYVIVGRPEFAINGNGAAYIFNKTTGVQIKKLVAATDPEADSDFGGSVDIYGDYAVVGAENDTISAMADQGSAYLFGKDAGGVDNWGEVTQLLANDGSASDFFGRDVAIWDKYIAVSAHMQNLVSGKGASNGGSVYIFDRSSPGVVKTQVLADDAGTDDNLGWSIDLKDYLLFASARRFDNPTNNEGAVYVFDWRNGGTQLCKLTASDGVVGDNLGESVSYNGRYIVAGTGVDDEGGTDRGAAFVWMLDMQADAKVGKKKEVVLGNDIYNTTAAMQRISIKKRGKIRWFYHIQNDGKTPAFFLAKATRGPRTFRPNYKALGAGGGNIRGKITGVGYTTKLIPVGGRLVIQAVVRKRGSGRAKKTFTMTAYPDSILSQKDKVKIKATKPK